MQNNTISSVLFQCLFVLLPCGLLGQINIDQYTDTYGEGEITLKKRIKVAFEYNEASDSYLAVVSHKYEKLYINESNANGLIQIPFNIYQDVKMERARYFKLDSLGEKTLIENVKVKFADTKDYFIENIFYNDLKVKQFKSSLELPDKYVLHYSYKTIYKDLKFLSSLYMQSAYEAVDDFEISILKNPKIDVALYEFNHNDQITKSEDGYAVKYSGKGLQRYAGRRNTVNGNYYLPHIIVSVQSVMTPKGKSNILSSTADMYSWYNSLVKTLQPDEAYIQKLTQPLISSASSDEEKISKIFKWVQRNVQYVAFEDGIAGFKPEEAKNVAKNKYGDCKGMANLLVNMLNSAGFNASHAWIGTRSNNYSYDIPSLVVDNHMICALDLNGKRYFLDATDKTASWDIPPAHIIGKEVMVGMGDSYEIKKIKSSAPADNNIAINGQMDLKSDVPNINLEFKLSGHFRKRYLAYNQYWSGANIKDIPYFLVKDYLQGVKVEQISAVKLTEESISFTVFGSYLNFTKNQESITVFPFLNLLPFKKLEVDNAPTYISFPYSVDANLKISENFSGGKKLLHKPVKSGNDDYYADYSFEKNDEGYVTHQKVFIGVLNSPLDDYSQWNEFISTTKSYNNYPIIYALSK